MVKDNHKNFFGGLEQAVQFFRQQRNFYTPLIVEVHSLAELEEAQALGVKHLLLDNFTPVQVRAAVEKKAAGVTFELSGGITPANIEEYLMAGVEAISLGFLTYAPRPVDISLKYHRPRGC